MRNLTRTQVWIFLLMWTLNIVAYPSTSGATSPQTLSEITVEKEKGQWRIVLTGPESVAYRATKVVDPLRLVVDLHNTQNEMQPKPFTVENEVIGRIKTAQLIHEPEPLTRVEIGLNKNVSYKISRKGKGIRISFNTAQPMTELEPIRTEPVVKPKVEQTPRAKKVAALKPLSKEPKPSSKPLRKSSLTSASKVLSIHQLRMDDELRYYIVANGTLDDYVSFHLTNPARLVVDLIGVKSTEIEGALSFGGLLIQKVRIGVYTSKVRVVFDLIPEAGLPYDIVSGKDRLLVSFKPGSSFPPK